LKKYKLIQFVQTVDLPKPREPSYLTHSEKSFKLVEYY